MNDGVIELEITIDDKGDVAYEVKGAKGRNCTSETAFLDEAIGKVKDRSFKRDYYENGVGTTRRVTTRHK